MTSAPTSSRGYFRVKGWEQFQHYTHRSPPWIKLYNSLLEDYEFLQLRESTQRHLVCLWLLASRLQNRIPNDAGYIRRAIHAQSAVDLDAMIDAGFLIPVDAEDTSIALASCEQNACLETESETEQRQRQRQSQTAGDASVEEVLAVYRELHPRRKTVGSKYPTIVRARLADGFTVGELIEALKGNAADPWHKEKRKHELSYVFRNADQVNQFRELHHQQENPAVVVGGELTPEQAARVFAK